MKNRLCIPIYLNEKIVFDLLAILEDGFSNINEVKTSISSENNIDSKIDGSLKSTGMFSALFGISFSSKVGAQSNNLENEENRREKIHTNTSLFSKLRTALTQSNSLKTISEYNGNILEVSVGDFVEIDGTISKNPMVETMETFIDAFNMALSFTDGTNKGSKKQNKDNEDTLNQIKNLYNDLTKSNTIDLMLSIDEAGSKNALLSAQLNYFVNGFESELIDGKYKVLGKVIKVIKDNESVNLFRKTSFKIFQEHVIDGFIDSINDGDDNQGLKLQPIVSSINGPAIMIIPIAIYI